MGPRASPGNIAANLESASQFLAEQKQIPAAAPLKTFQDAIYTEGLPVSSPSDVETDCLTT